MDAANVIALSTVWWLAEYPDGVVIHVIE